MEEFLPRSFSDGNVADVCKYGTERDTLLQPLFLKFGWDCTVFGNFSPRRPYKVIVCVYVFSSAGERVEGNLEGYGTVEFNDGHTYKVR